MRKLIIILLLALPFSGITQIGLPGVLYVSGCTPDADAQKFIDSAAITDPTQIAAICNLVASLKSASLWTSFYAIYPLVGGTAASHKWNLKDPRNLDAAYRLTFTNTPTQSSNGIDFNGSTQFGDTKFNTFPNGNSTHISLYLRENTAFAGGDMGNTGSSANDGIGLYARWTDNSVFWNTDNAAFVSTTSTDSRGFHVVTRTASNARALYRNGSSVQTSTTASSAASVKNIFIGCDNGLVNYSNRQSAFYTIGLGLSGAQVTALNTIVEAFQDALGRGVQ